MSHPHNEHRQHKVEHSRVGHITRGYASGGAVSDEETREEKPYRKTQKVEAHPAKADGGAVKPRMDRPARAKGGRVKHGKTNVNVIVGGAHPAPAPMPMPAGGPPMAAMPPRPMPPPMAAGAPPMAPPGVGAPMPPPGIRRAGGRTYRNGGAVKFGAAFEEGKRAGTQVQHSDGKLDGKDIGRKPVITKATGGAVEHPRLGAMGPLLPGGSGGGEGRLAKIKKYGSKPQGAHG